MDSDNNIFFDSIKAPCIEYISTKPKKLGFNIFSIVSNTYYRENFHSDILSFLLNSQINQDENGILLNRFILLLNSIGKAIDYNNYIDAESIREEGRIDILIKSESTKHAIVIENKMNNAVDMPRQIPRYYDYLCDNGYTIDAIVYIPLANNKMPNTASWSGEDLAHIYPLLVILPAYSKDGSKNMVDSWLIPTVDELHSEDMRVVVKHFVALIKYLNNNLLNYTNMQEFYNQLLQNKNISLAIAMHDMVENLSKFLAERIKNNFANNFEPFKNIWIYNEKKTFDTVFEGAIIKDVYVKLDIWCHCDSENQRYDVLIWNPKDKEMSNSKEVLAQIMELPSVQAKPYEQVEFDNTAAAYVLHFGLYEERSMIEFLDNFLKDLREGHLTV
ncbi:MAG: PD-(D/E)XK nuclease family protein [Paludibacteraceae bacterium]|nr:PD-(D/E)XK nuclease family protein [Paludibacteraceae bacterium]